MHLIREPPRNSSSIILHTNKFAWWFWWSWGWFFSRSSSSGFATISIITKTIPRTNKTTRQISSCVKLYSSYFWARSLIECRDYIEHVKQNAHAKIHQTNRQPRQHNKLQGAPECLSRLLWKHNGTTHSTHMYTHVVKSTV